MRKLLWLLNGVVLGFIAAHFVNQTPEGRRFFDRVGRGLEEFGRAFSNGYHEAEPNDADFEAALRDLTTKQ
ncbi:hypothetical protein JOF28_000350 [Leucobacter exalbidus]|uniref:Uncharacterized protein n=1 Tax=Leucobacter exalbidus TaxID=662960 RepID=A0A940PL80_9MICO|nr:hypothetical protein [Leucobacter exalbidus]MBP1325118.1 hypothetical protein [Leucobacter exalbidus]